MVVSEVLNHFLICFLHIEFLDSFELKKDPQSVQSPDTHLYQISLPVYLVGVLKEIHSLYPLISRHLQIIEVII